jgi:hypothetical protein
MVDIREKGILDPAAEASRQERGNQIAQRMASRLAMGAPSFAQPSSLKPSTGFHSLQSLAFSASSNSQFSQHAEVSPSRSASHSQAISPTTLVVLKVRPLGFRPASVGTQFAEKVGLLELTHPSEDTMDSMFTSLGQPL